MMNLDLEYGPARYLWESISVKSLREQLSSFPSTLQERRIVVEKIVASKRKLLIGLPSLYKLLTCSLAVQGE